jgi:hypothetical protein
VEKFCDICCTNDCYHLTLNKDLLDPLDNWVLHHCPNKESGNVCIRDCAICGGIGLVRLKWGQLKEWSRHPTTPKTIKSDDPFIQWIVFDCPHCKVKVSIKLIVSCQIKISVEEKNGNFECGACKKSFEAFTFPANKEFK